MAQSQWPEPIPWRTGKAGVVPALDAGDGTAAATSTAAAAPASTPTPAANASPT